MLIVQKYGGTSVGSCEKIERVAKKIASCKDEGNKLVVVVSAIGGETDRLLKLVNYFGAFPNTREVDVALSTGEQVSSALTAIALNKIGYKAISLNGRDAGIFTDDTHTKAKIKFIDVKTINKYLKDDYIVIVAGFQGIDKNGNTTTLGRGGSDLSAVAIAGALKADLCEIYTDVDGVYTTDPKIEPKAKKIDKISYDEMLELASLGAKVLLNRSVELAKKLKVKVITKSSFNDTSGTLIINEEDMVEKPIISGIALDSNQARISMVDVDDKPGIAASIFNSLAEENVNVDMIVQTIGRDGKTDIDFTIPKTDLSLCKKILNKFQDSTKQIEFDENVAKVSVVGLGMKSNSGVASKAFAAMGKEKINIMMISTSEIKISMLIDIKDAELAVRTLHNDYELDK